MKKSIAFLMCLVALIMLGTVCAYADDVDDGALTVTITAEDGLEVPQEGLAVTVYAGSWYGISSGGGNMSYCYPYQHYARANGKVTNIFGNGFESSYSETVYLDPATRKATATLYLKKYEHHIAYYIHPSSGYIGSGSGWISNKDSTAEMTVSYIKAVTLSGTITVPATDKDIEYDINVIGDVTQKPEIEYDYSFSESDTLKAGDTTINYSIYVRPDMDYDVYVDFDDIYKVEHKTIYVGRTNAVLDFKAERANKITGTIKLPEGWNEFKDTEGNTVENVQFNVCLQDADAPHDLIDTDGVILSPDSRTAEFTLYNITDTENLIVYYDVVYPYHVKDLCDGAAYMNDTQCTFGVKRAKVLNNENQNIIINMLAGKTIELTVESQSPVFQDYFMGSLRAIMTDGSGTYVRGYGTAESYYVTLPASCTEYILNLADDNDLRGVYYTENGFTRDISEADPISASETEKTVTLDRYEPDMPMTYMVSQSDSNPNLYYVNYTNTSDFDIENVYVYTYTEYLDGEVLIERESFGRAVTFILKLPTHQI